MKTSFPVALLALVLSACGPDKPPAEALRMVRTVELRYESAHEANRYSGTVQARHEVDQGFRVGGKIASRKVDVGQSVREGDVLAVLDDTDYRLAEEAARQQLVAATAQARQAESDRSRLQALKGDGSVSASDEEQAQTRAQQTKAAAEAEERRLELARNRLKYTVLRASRAGVVTQVRAEVGQVLAEGQPVVSIATQGEPEIVVDVPEEHFASFKKSQYKASLATAPGETFEVGLRELSLQAAQPDADVSRAVEARDPETAAARCERHGARRAHGGGNADGRDPVERDHAGERPAGGVGGSPRGGRARGDGRAYERRRARLPQ